jgi:hypothetical protein
MMLIVILVVLQCFQCCTVVVLSLKMYTEAFIFYRVFQRQPLALLFLFVGPVTVAILMLFYQSIWFSIFVISLLSSGFSFCSLCRFV